MTNFIFLKAVTDCRGRERERGVGWGWSWGITVMVCSARR